MIWIFLLHLYVDMLWYQYLVMPRYLNILKYHFWQYRSKEAIYWCIFISHVSSHLYHMHMSCMHTHMYTGHEMRTEKCSDMCQHKIKFVLTFAKNDLTLVDTYVYCSIILWLRYLPDQSDLYRSTPIVLENVTCLTYFILCVYIHVYMYARAYKRNTDNFSIIVKCFSDVCPHAFLKLFTVCTPAYIQCFVCIQSCTYTGAQVMSYQNLLYPDTW